MPKQSPPSVKITYFNREYISEALNKFVRELARKCPEVERVILFGSFARGEGVPGSDIDLLIVLKESNIPFFDRIPKYTPSRFPIGMDVFPYTEEELAQMLGSDNFFVRGALSEGTNLYQRRISKLATP